MSVHLSCHWLVCLLATMVYYQSEKFMVLSGTRTYPNLQLPDEIKDLIDADPENENNEPQIYVYGGWIYIIFPASGELLKNGGAWSMEYSRLRSNVEGRWQTWAVSGGKLAIAIRVLFPFQTEQIIKGWLAQVDKLGRANNGTSELFNFNARLDIIIKLLREVLQFEDTGVIFDEEPGKESGNLSAYQEEDFDDVKFPASANTFVPGQIQPEDLRYADTAHIVVSFYLGSGKPKAGVFNMEGVMNIIRELRTSVANAGSFEQGYTNMLFGPNSPFSRILAGPTNKRISTAKSIPPLENFVKDPNNVFPFAGYSGGAGGLGPGGLGPGGGGPGGPPPGGGGGGRPSSDDDSDDDGDGGGGSPPKNHYRTQETQVSSSAASDSRGGRKRSRKRSRTPSVSSTHAAVASSKGSWKVGRGNKKRASGKSKRGRKFKKQSSNIQELPCKQRDRSYKVAAAASFTPPAAASSRGPSIPTTTNLSGHDSDDESRFSKVSDMMADDDSKDPQIAQALRESKELEEKEQRKRRKVDAEEEAQMKQAIQTSLFTPGTPTVVVSSGVPVKSEDHAYECDTEDECGGAPIAEVVISGVTVKNEDHRYDSETDDDDVVEVKANDKTTPTSTAKPTEVEGEEKEKSAPVKDSVSTTGLDKSPWLPPTSNWVGPQVLPGHGGPVRSFHPHDVISGRGGRINSHPGNVHFRTIAKSYEREYLFSTKKDEKARIAALVVSAIRSLDPPGRFLKEDSHTNNWLEIGDERARKKSGQALRESGPEIRAELAGKNAGRNADPPPSSSSRSNNYDEPELAATPRLPQEHCQPASDVDLELQRMRPVDTSAASKINTVQQRQEEKVKSKRQGWTTEEDEDLSESTGRIGNSRILQRRYALAPSAIHAQNSIGMRWRRKHTVGGRDYQPQSTLSVPTARSIYRMHAEQQRHIVHGMGQGMYPPQYGYGPYGGIPSQSPQGYPSYPGYPPMPYGYPGYPPQTDPKLLPPSPDDDSKDKPVVWHDVGDKKARERASQCLRDRRWNVVYDAVVASIENDPEEAAQLSAMQLQSDLLTLQQRQSLMAASTAAPNAPTQVQAAAPINNNNTSVADQLSDEELILELAKRQQLGLYDGVPVRSIVGGVDIKPMQIPSSTNKRGKSNEEDIDDDEVIEVWDKESSQK